MSLTKEIESLLGDYWELAYEEGRMQVSNGDKANEVLHKLRHAIEIAVLDAQAEHEFSCLQAVVSSDGGHNLNMKDRHFTVNDAGFILDETFDFDAGLQVSGDFVAGEKKQYAEMIASVLNSVSSAPRKETSLMEWRPIETAPADGTEILVKDGVGGVHGAKWTTYRDTTGWFHHTNMGWLPSATSWMPMPDKCKSRIPALMYKEYLNKLRADAVREFVTVYSDKYSYLGLAIKKEAEQVANRIEKGKA